MSKTVFLDNLPVGKALAHVMLAHGSMAPMDSPFLEELAQSLVDRDLAVHRFEFAYMAQRRSTGKKRPPPKAEKLADEYRNAIDQLRSTQEFANAPIIIAGKSLGGRVASFVAPDCVASGQVSGLVCLGYPFHPPKKPESLRTAHLERFACSTLILQGERDPFGTPEEIATYSLDPAIEFHWVSDGDHDFAARKRSGFTQSGNIAAAAQAIAEFATRLKKI